MIRDKGELRLYLLSRRAELGSAIRKKKSGEIMVRILSLPEFERANTVMLFLNVREEVETTNLAQQILDRGKRLILPRCTAEGMMVPAEVNDLAAGVEKGSWGIREPKAGQSPVDPEEINVVFVPGVGFDRQGNRLGYGKGYYDRFLSMLDRHTPRIGVAFECQVIDQIFAEPHDEKVTMVVTEKSVYRV